MGRILSIDFGERHIGLAISDETRTIAQGLDTLTVARAAPRFRNGSLQLTGAVPDSDDNPGMVAA